MRPPTRFKSRSIPKNAEVGVIPRAVLDKFAAIQMLDVYFPTTDGRTLILSRYTHPEPDHKVLLEQLNLRPVCEIHYLTLSRDSQYA